MPPVMNHHQSTPPRSNGDDAAILQAHTAAHSNQPHTPPNPSAAEVALDTELFGPNTTYMGAPPVAQPPVPQQSQPTQVLYERARLAATSKASPNARRAGLPSQRRPWTTEEENALMAGLDRVKGPHWSQILAMFGPGGTVSEALKDRNQVQLKDKARNLKLFFLKSGIEVPYYLQFVTGELKTRAPGQAAKNAAKKAVEASAEEDAAHITAVTVLGNAHRADSHDLYHNMGNDMNVSPSPDMGGHQQDESEQGSVPPEMDMQTSGLAVGNGPPMQDQHLQEHEQHLHEQHLQEHEQHEQHIQEHEQHIQEHEQHLEEQHDQRLHDQHEQHIQEQHIQEHPIQEHQIQEQHIQEHIQDHQIQDHQIQEHQLQEHQLQEHQIQEHQLQEHQIQEHQIQEHIIQEHIQDHLQELHEHLQDQGAPQAPMAPMAPMGSGPQLQPQHRQEDEEAGDRVDPSLMGVDPQLHTGMVGHEVSAERGT